MVGRTLWNRRIVARDGVELAADVILPRGDGPWPALVSRTPYMRGRNLRPESRMRLVQDGYAFVVVDVRGRGDSDGQFTPFAHDAEDGYDVIEWVASQPWCNGRVGMVGGSYEGLTQWWTAKGRPPHLSCIVPQAVGAASVGPRPSCDTGVPVLYWLWWFNLVTGRTMQHASAPAWEANYGRLPLRASHERVGTAQEWWPKYVAGEIDYLGADQVLSAEEWNQFVTPALVVAGWWDDQTTMTTWAAVKNSPAGERSRLLIGAWDHAGNLKPRSELGGLDVSSSAIDTVSYIERFLALHLKDDASAIDELPRCRVFRTGLMEWESLDDWPNREATTRPWYLGPNGALSEQGAPEDGEFTYIYDPMNPVRDFSNLDVLAWSDPPLDARYLLRRRDALVFTGTPLEHRLDLSGRARFEGFVSVDCADTDVVAALHDVHPDGRSIVLGSPAIRRLAYRNGPAAEPMAGGDPVRIEMPLTWLHHSFMPGHRIRLVVTSSCYPTFAPNTNTGEPWADATKSRPARVTIHYGGRSQSRLVLPVEPVATRP